MKRKKLKSPLGQKLAGFENESKSLFKLPAEQDDRSEGISDALSDVEKCLRVFKLTSVINDIEIKLLTQKKMLSILKSIKKKDINKEPLHKRANIYRILADCQYDMPFPH